MLSRTLYKEFKNQNNIKKLNLKNQNEIEAKILSRLALVKSSISLVPEIEKSISAIIKCLKKGNKVVLFGNGGSAADAQHIAAELVGKFNLKRKSLPAIALTSNSSTITALSNDFSFETVFSRQCESLISKGDVSIGISTSGNSAVAQLLSLALSVCGPTTLSFPTTSVSVWHVLLVIFLSSRYRPHLHVVSTQRMSTLQSSTTSASRTQSRFFSSLCVTRP